MPIVDHIEAILFDMNGTLRQRLPDEAWQRQSAGRLLSLLEMSEAPAGFIDELHRRYKAYAAWADETGQVLSEAEAWSRWIAPDLPPGLTGPRAAGLMLALRNCRGRTVLKPGALKVIAELHRRGYRLGVISNTTSTADLPGFIEENGLGRFFEVVVLSAVCGARKPAPKIFWEAAAGLGLPPGQCAYLGNKSANDVAGPRRAGFGLAVLVRPAGAAPGAGENPAGEPDLIIHELSELLDLFPPRA
jgi:HAD superfamily hydrolase (TIGR01549 family)